MTRSWHQNVKRAPASARTSEEGFVFDSKLELQRWNDLKILEKSGYIKGLMRQHRFDLAFDGHAIKIRSARYPNGRACSYTADFSFFDNVTQKAVYEEVKGHDSAESRLRRAIVEALYGIEITVTGPAAKDTPRKVAHTGTAG